MNHHGRAFILCVLGLVFVVGPLFAQAPNPQAKDLFEKARQAMSAKDFKTAVDHLRAAKGVDNQMWGWADSSVADQILAGLKEQSQKNQQDVAIAKNLGWLYAEKGMYKEGLAEYKRIQAQSGSDQEVKDQLGVLEAYVAANASAGTSSSSGSGSSGSSTPSGGDASSSQTPPTQASPGAGSEEANSLKETLKKKDDEIANLQKEKEDLQKQIDELKADNQKLQLYKTQLIIKQGGLK